MHNNWIKIRGIRPITIHHPESPSTYRAQINDLMQAVFGFTFERWFARGLWPEDYTLYSILAEGRMLAHAAAFRMDLIVNGHEVEAYQIGSVATRADQRGQGLSRQVIEFILAQHSGAPFFLCPNERVLDFYPRFGFRLLHDRQPRVRLHLDNPPGALQPLNVDAPRVGDYLRRQACFSRSFDCRNAAPIHWFHLLYNYPEQIYALPGLDALLVAEQAGETLTLVDLFAAHPLKFEELLPHLGFRGVEEIRFGFNPDWLGVECEWVEHVDSEVFVRGEWELGEKFLLPLMLKT
jgi:GNAT superfamily N-acetyltransferase